MKKEKDPQTNENKFISLLILVAFLCFAYISRLQALKSGSKVFLLLDPPDYIADSNSLLFGTITIELIAAILFLVICLVGLVLIITIPIGIIRWIVGATPIRLQLFLVFVGSIATRKGLEQFQFFFYSHWGIAIFVSLEILLLLCKFQIVHSSFIEQSSILYTVIPLLLLLFSRPTLVGKNKNIPRFNISFLDGVISISWLVIIFSGSHSKTTLGLFSLMNFVILFEQCATGFKSLISSIQLKQYDWRALLSSFVFMVLSTIVVFAMGFKTAILTFENHSSIIDNTRGGRELYIFEGKLLTQSDDQVRMDISEQVYQDDLNVLFFSAAVFLSFPAGDYFGTGVIKLLVTIEGLFSYIISLLVVAYGIAAFTSKRGSEDGHTGKDGNAARQIDPI